MRERQICSVCTAIERDTDAGTFGAGCDLNRCRITNRLSSMAENHSTKGHPTKGHSQRHGGAPLVVASAVAAFGVLAMLIVDHGPWNKPKVQPAVMATYSTTGEAARAVGATITPTEPKPAIEPLPAGPKPVHPVNPPTPMNPPTPP
jgi:hypothetical protein